MKVVPTEPKPNVENFIILPKTGSYILKDGHIVKWKSHSSHDDFENKTVIFKEVIPPFPYNFYKEIQSKPIGDITLFIADDGRQWFWYGHICGSLFYCASGDETINSLDLFYKNTY